MNEASRLEEILLQGALAYASPEAQAAYLAGACGDDHTLRERVQALLQTHAKTPARAADPLGPMPSLSDIVVPVTDQPGDRIGRYRLQEKIGEGGFGVVYLAEQEEPVRRRVALKILKLGMDTRAVVGRFEAERQALALMDHPNIAKVLDAGATHTGRPYFVMEWIPGIRITEYCDREKLPNRERLGLFVQVCAAVQHAHQKGIIHRDIKPSNILVTGRDGEGVPKVIDFGIAKALDRRLTEMTLVTGPEQLLGTPVYMSPEQAGMGAGGPGDVDTRTDVYSLGVLLYELLTGQTPFEAAELLRAGVEEVRRKIREVEPPKPSTRLTTLAKKELEMVARMHGAEAGKLAGQVRGDLDWIVMKCLEKNRVRRYETADALARDIERHLNDQPVEAVAPSVAYRVKKFARRHRVGLVMASAVAGAVLIGLVLSVWQGARAEQALQLATRRLYESLVDRAQARRLSGQAGQRFESLSAIGEAAHLVPQLGLGQDHLLKLRNEAIATMTLADLRVDRQWPDNPAVIHRMCADATVELMAQCEPGAGWVVRRLDDHHELARLPGEGLSNCWTVAGFSPNGQLLACWAYGTGVAASVEVWDWRSRTLRLRQETSWDGALEFSPEGRRCALVGVSGSLDLYDLPDGRGGTAGLWKRLQGAGKRAPIVFSPDGQRLVACLRSEPHVFEIVDLDGVIVQKLPHAQPVQSIAWHPRGRILATGCTDQNVYLWEAAAGKLKALLRGHRGGVIGLTFSSAGDLLASSAYDRSTRLWDPLTGREQLRGPGGARQFSLDDRWLGFGGSDSPGRHGRFEVAAARECRALEGYPANHLVWALDYSADGRLLATAAAPAQGTTEPDNVRLWDSQSGILLAALPASAPCSVMFEPDDRHLIVGGTDGVYRWPLSCSQEGPRVAVRVGQSRRIMEVTGGAWGWADLSRDGHALAVINAADQAVVLNPDQPAQLITLGPLRRQPWTIAISPEGQWVAIGSYAESQTMIWNAQTGALRVELPGFARHVTFSPDGRWLVVNNGATAHSLWSTGTWQLCHRTKGGYTRTGAAFSVDGRTLALAVLGGILLLDPTTGRELGTLSNYELQEHQAATAFRFSPDASQLAVGMYNGSIQLWDLGRIRAQLAELGLDWDQPAAP